MDIKQAEITQMLMSRLFSSPDSAEQKKVTQTILTQLMNNNVIDDQRKAPTSLNYNILSNNREAYEDSLKSKTHNTLDLIEGNVVIFGHTGTGKTTFVRKMFAFNKIQSYDLFVYVKHMAEKNAVNDLDDVRNIVVSSMQVYGKVESTEANNNFLFYRDTQVEDAINYCENVKDVSKKTVIFFDDIQVGDGNIKQNLDKITNFMGRCRKVNTQVIISIHKSFLDTKNLRGEASYLVLINPDEDTFNRLTGHQHKLEYKIVVRPIEKSDKGAIIDVHNNGKLYDLHFRELTPLVPIQQTQQTN